MSQFKDLSGQKFGRWTVLKRDAIKNQWCKDNNIPLIRIPYTRLNNLSIKDLILKKEENIYDKKEKAR